MRDHQNGQPPRPTGRAPSSSHSASNHWPISPATRRLPSSLSLYRLHMRLRTVDASFATTQSTGVPIDPYVRPSRRTSVYLAARASTFTPKNGRMLITLSLKGSIEGHLTPLVDLATSKYTHFVYASAHLTSHSADTRPTNPSSASTCVSELLDASLPLPTQVGPSVCTCVRPVAHPSTRRSARGCSRPAGSHAVRARLPRLRNSYHAR